MSCDDGAWADALLAAIQRRGTRRVPIGEVVAALVEVRPDLATAGDRFRRLGLVLDALAARGSVTLTARQVRYADAALPSSVVLARPVRAAVGADPALTHPWVPSMRWVAEVGRQPLLTRQRLIQLNRWLANHRDRPVVPVRERSLDIFGDDKVLERLLRRGGVLAAAGRQPPELRVEVVHPPMAVERVSANAGSGLLVVENGTTFHSVLRAARQHANAGTIDLGWVGYGSGEQLPVILPSVARLDPRPSFVGYFGDLDPPGLRFAAAGAAVSANGLPRMEPHRLLYAWLLQRGRVQPRTDRASWPAEGLAWLGTRLAARVQQVLGDEGWLAQEWVGLELLASSAAWASREALD